MQTARGAAILILSCAFAVQVRAEPECLTVVQPGAVVSGGAYRCIIVARPAAGATLEDVEVSGGPGDGISVDADDVTITHVHVHDSAASGLLARCQKWSDEKVCDEHPKRLKISRSSFIHNGNNGIKFDGCADCEVHQSLIAHNDNSGVHVNPIPRLLFTDNEIVHNGNWTKHWGHGMYGCGVSSQILHNNVHHNQGWGLHLWPGPVSPAAAPNIVRDNRVWKNGGGIVVAAKVEHLDLRGNEEFSNGDSAFEPCPLGQRPGVVIRAVSGDTLVARLTLLPGSGRGRNYKGRVRLADVDAPETTAEGAAATAWMKGRLPPGEPFCFEGGDRRDPEGRPLVVIYDSDGNVDEAILREGLAMRTRAASGH